jgi:hypothetical protein
MVVLQVLLAIITAVMVMVVLVHGVQMVSTTGIVIPTMVLDMAVLGMVMDMVVTDAAAGITEVVIPDLVEPGIVVTTIEFPPVPHLIMAVHRIVGPQDPHIQVITRP